MGRMKSTQSSLNYALYLLGRRGRSVYELRSKLFEKEFEAVEIEKTLQKLTKLGFLDDQKFAELYARDKVTIYRRGRYRIAQELRLKGVDKEVVEATIKEVNPSDELASAVSLLKGRARAWRGLTDRQRFERGVHLLQRRGFGGATIKEAVQIDRKSHPNGVAG